MASDGAASGQTALVPGGGKRIESGGGEERVEPLQPLPASGDDVRVLHIGCQMALMNAGT